MKLAYGYLHIGDRDDEEIQQLKCGIQKLAETAGFCLIEIFTEYQPEYYGTFYHLTAELKRTQARHVIVPSLDHLSSHPLLRDQLLMRLEEAGAQTWAVER